MGFLLKIFGQGKLILAAIVGGALAFLASWLKIVQVQRDKARLEAAQQAKRAAAVEEKIDTQRAVAQAVVETRREAREVERENQERRDSGTRPSGDFGDRRLRDDP